MNDPALWIALIAMLVSCYFATLAGALRHFSRSRLAEFLEERSREQRLERFLDRVPKMALMCGMLRTAMNLVVLLAVLSLLDHIQRLWLQYLLAFIVAGAGISIFAIAVPASIVRYHPEKIIARSTLMLNICLMIFGPLADAMHLFDPIVRRISGAAENTANGDDLLTEEILSVVEEHEDESAVDESQKDMLEGVIELRSTTADQIMTPRTEINGIELSATLDQVKAAILEFGHSRIPVYHDKIDDIVGVLYAKDMIRYIRNGTEWNIDQVIRKPLVVPESKSVNDLLAEFKQRKVHMAIVVDEYGGTAGLITIEDILEEIVGEIQDEYEPGDETPAIHRLDDVAAEVDARVRVTEINDELDLELPENEDYDTVGGFVFATLGHVPEVGESFDFQRTRVSVLAAERTRVTRVRIDILESPATPSNGQGDSPH